jgi:hypothetical protein
MKKIAALVALFFWPALALAQTYSMGAPVSEQNPQPSKSMCWNGSAYAPCGSSTPLVTAGKQESVSLAAANTAASPATVYGGSYVFSQACTGYNSGSLVLQYLGPDGASWITMSSKTASDSSGGTLISLGSSAVVRVTLPSGSTACNATLARVP